MNPIELTDKALLAEVQRRASISENASFRMELFQTIAKSQATASLKDPNLDDRDVLFDAFGIFISQYVGWIGEDIQKIAVSAFEDSNYHTFNRLFQAIDVNTYTIDGKDVNELLPLKAE